MGGFMVVPPEFLISISASPICRSFDLPSITSSSIFVMEEKDAIEINEADKLQKYLSDTLTQISGKQYVFRDSQEILTLY